MPTLKLEIEIALAVPLEGGGCGMHGTAVGLHDQALHRPVEIHLVSANKLIDDGQGKIRIPYELEKQPLELTPRRQRLVGQPHDAPEPPGATPPRRAGEHRFKRTVVVELQYLRLLYGTLEPPGC